MPLGKVEAKRRLRHIVDNGGFRRSKHSRIEAAKDRLDDVDIVNVLRCGAVDEPEWENGEWRFKSRTATIVVCWAFDPDPDEAEGDEVEVVIVTVWRVRS